MQNYLACKELESTPGKRVSCANGYKGCFPTVQLYYFYFFKPLIISEAVLFLSGAVKMKRENTSCKTKMYL